MSVASEIKHVGDLTVPGSGIAALTPIGNPITLHVGTKWAVIFATAASGSVVHTHGQGAVSLFDGIAERLVVTPPGLAGGSAHLSNGGHPLAILDASEAELTLQVRASAGNTNSYALSGMFILEQMF